MKNQARKQEKEQLDWTEAHRIVDVRSKIAVVINETEILYDGVLEPLFSIRVGRVADDGQVRPYIWVMKDTEFEAGARIKHPVASIISDLTLQAEGWIMRKMQEYWEEEQAELARV